MQDQTLYTKPLVSVIIPCYNHGRFLHDAINSVLEQTYPSIEILVVDDGSGDNTAEVAAAYPEVKYFYKKNAGLSAARNTGIEKSSGEYIVFLDADDWLYKDAVEVNLSYFNARKELALVSGAYDRFFVADNSTKEEITELSEDPYWHLLHGNFIGVPAAVMYSRRVFSTFRFDAGLKACEDYDMYLNIFRHYPVHHHTHKVAAYRTHASNMSSNIPLMLCSALKVLKRQKTQLKTEPEKRAYLKGRSLWKDYYCYMLWLKLKQGKSKAPGVKELLLLLKYRPFWLIKNLLSKNVKPALVHE